MKKLLLVASVALSLTLSTTAQNFDYFTTANSIQYANVLATDSALYYPIKEANNSSFIYALQNGIETKLVKVDNNFSTATLLKNQSFTYKNNAALLIQDYITARYTLWVSNGTVAGTDSVLSYSNYQNTLYPAGNIGNDYYFTITNSVLNTTDVYKTNFTKAGTVKLKSYSNIFIATPYVDNGNLYLSGTIKQGVYSYTILYSYTTDTTRLLLGHSFMRVYNNNLYYDYSNSSTLMKKDLTTNTTITLGGSFTISRFLGFFNNKFYLLGDFQTQTGNSTGIEIYSTAGNANDLTLLKDCNNNNNAASFANVGGANYIFGNTVFYFVAKNSNNHSTLFTSDGTTAGTHEIQDLQAAGTPAASGYMKICGDKLFFNANNYSIGTTAYAGWMLSTCDSSAQSLTPIHFETAGYASPFADAYNTLNFQNKIIFKGNDGSVTTNNKLFVIDACASFVAPTNLASITTTKIVHVYPNPNNGIFTVAIGAQHVGKQLQLYNALGQLANSYSITSTTITINDLTTGLYIAKIQGEQGAQKIIVK